MEQGSTSRLSASNISFYCTGCPKGPTDQQSPALSPQPSLCDVLPVGVIWTDTSPSWLPFPGHDLSKESFGIWCPVLDTHAWPGRWANPLPSIELSTPCKCVCVRALGYIMGWPFVGCAWFIPSIKWPVLGVLKSSLSPEGQVLVDRCIIWNLDHLSP